MRFVVVNRRNPSVHPTNRQTLNPM